MDRRELYLATVTSEVPLKVRIDGTTTELMVTYLSELVTALAVDDRVAITVIDRIVTVLQKLYPDLTASAQGAGPPTGIPVNGRTYYDLTNSRLWRGNGNSWVFERAYDATKRPGVVLQGAGQLIGAGASVTVIWTTETSDVDGWITVPGTTLTVPPGWDGSYVVTHRTFGSVSSVSNVECSMLVNGSLVLNSAGPFANAYRSNTGTFTGLSAGDTLSCVVFNGSAGGITFSNVLVLNWLYR